MFITLRLQYEDNRNDEHDGFHILRKYNINNLSDEKRKEIERLTKGNLQSPRSVYDEFRSYKDSNTGGGVYVAESGTTVQTTRVDIKNNGDFARTDGRRNRGAGDADRGRGEVAPEASEGGITLYNRHYSPHTKVAVLY